MYSMLHVCSFIILYIIKIITMIILLLIIFIREIIVLHYLISTPGSIGGPGQKTIKYLNNPSFLERNLLKFAPNT